MIDHDPAEAGKLEAAMILIEDGYAEGSEESLVREIRHLRAIHATQTAELTAAKAELATLQTIRDRVFDGDVNDLQNRMESREPLSLADQHELYEWLQEKDIIIGDYDEKIVAQEAELTAAKAELVALREDVKYIAPMISEITTLRHGLKAVAAQGKVATNALSEADKILAGVPGSDQTKGGE